MSTISLKVNGQLHTLEGDPTTPLLFVLTDELGLRGPKFGCGMAQCGSCIVLLRGQAVRSCVLPVSAVHGDEITTLEGLGTAEKPHPIQQAFIDEGAAQFGQFVPQFSILEAPYLWRDPQQVRRVLASPATTGSIGMPARA